MLLIDLIVVHSLGAASRCIPCSETAAFHSACHERPAAMGPRTTQRNSRPTWAHKPQGHGPALIDDPWAWVALFCLDEEGIT